MSRSDSLRGKVALVTGGARGIGRGIALCLAEAGAAVAVADLHPEPFSGERYYRLRERVSTEEEKVSTADRARELGVAATQHQMDVADPASVAQAVAQCVSELGEIDVLVNNAAIVNNIASIADMSPESWDHEIKVNLSGAFHCVQAIAPGMAARGWGRIVNIASVAARLPSPGQAAYSASKAGVIAFTQAVAQEFGASGVTANAILPGLIGTPLVLSMPQSVRESIVARTPVKRLGLPEDIGRLATFLASPEASFITAAAIPCDGGFLGATT